MEERIVQHRPEQPTRPYRKVDDMKDHKAFILSQRKAGKKHKFILAALKAQKGVTIKPYQLKRMLGIWEASHKNLTKSRKLHIRNGIQKREGFGKQTHKIILKRSGREVMQEEMDAITSATPGYFRGIMPSPGDAVFSTPTPRGCSEEIEENDVKFHDDIDMGDDIAGDGLSEHCLISKERLYEICNDDANGDMEGFDEMEDVGGDIGDYPDSDSSLIVCSSEGEEDSMVDFEERDIESPEQLIEAFISLGRNNGGTFIVAKEWDLHSVPLCELEDNIEELQEIISNGFSKIYSKEEEEQEEPTTSSESDDIIMQSNIKHQTLSDRAREGALELADDNFQPETPLSRYACQNRHHFWAEVEEWEYAARKFLEDVKRVSKERGEPLSKAADIVSLEWEQSEVETLPYHIYKQILDEDDERMAPMKSLKTSFLRSTRRPPNCPPITGWGRYLTVTWFIFLLF
ncbi:hypothetical protein ABW20_dc0107199 [Dactylellina cionopaga]|nr:hypothetical protein ABW20_dc0107199 [Dactylellina cionopaga]